MTRRRVFALQGHACPERWRCRHLCPSLWRLQGAVERGLSAEQLAEVSQSNLARFLHLLGRSSFLVRSAASQTAAYLERAGRRDEAIVVLRAALEEPGRERAKERLWRQQTELNLGRLLIERGDDEEGASLLTGVVEKGLGGEPPGGRARDNTACALAWLAYLRGRQGRDDDQLSLLRQIHRFRTEHDGEDSPATLVAAERAAVATFNAGAHELGVTQLREVLDRSARSLGANHPDTILARWHLAGALGNLGADAEAQVLATAVLDARRHDAGDDRVDAHEVQILLERLDSRLDR